LARNRSFLSDATKMRLAQLQGAGDRVSPGDYGNLTSREAGNFVKYALAAAERSLADQTPIPQPDQR
jgi:small acid-soluble spore protein F (minor alpha/beta-type SASP)